jgi:hypothetical protein
VLSVCYVQQFRYVPSTLRHCDCIVGAATKIIIQRRACRRRLDVEDNPENDPLENVFLNYSPISIDRLVALSLESRETAIQTGTRSP